MGPKERLMEENESYCWDFVDCPQSVRSKCPVYLNKSIRCWEYDGRRCNQILGFECDCKRCKYYRARIIRDAVEDTSSRNGRL